MLKNLQNNWLKIVSTTCLVFRCDKGFFCAGKTREFHTTNCKISIFVPKLDNKATIITYHQQNILSLTEKFVYCSQGHSRYQ